MTENPRDGAIIIALINKKGGVGKTSSTHHLGGTLARDGRRVLLVDNDPQASLTMGLFGPAATREIPRDASVAALYDDALGAIPEALIRATPFDRLSIVPGSDHLTDYNMYPRDRWPDHQRGMAEFLDECRVDFDVILIDCAPNLHLCSQAALIAADAVVVPLQAEDYGAMGIVPILDAIAAVQAGPNPDLRLLGFLLTMFDKRLAIHTAYERQLRELYGPDVFENPFPLAKDFKEAVASGMPISHYKPKTAAAKGAKAVADELMARARALRETPADDLEGETTRRVA